MGPWHGVDVSSHTPELTWLFRSLHFKQLLTASALQPMWRKRAKITAFESRGNKPCMTFLGQHFFPVSQQPNSLLGLLVTEVPRLHTIRQTRGRAPLNKRSAPRKGRCLHRNTSMPSAGFEPATPAIKRLQTYALDSIATGIGFWFP